MEQTELYRIDSRDIILEEMKNLHSETRVTKSSLNFVSTRLGKDGQGDGWKDGEMKSQLVGKVKKMPRVETKKNCLLSKYIRWNLLLFLAFSIWIILCIINIIYNITFITIEGLSMTRNMTAKVASYKFIVPKNWIANLWKTVRLVIKQINDVQSVVTTILMTIVIYTQLNKLHKTFNQMVSINIPKNTYREKKTIKEKIIPKEAETSIKSHRIPETRRPKEPDDFEVKKPNEPVNNNYYEMNMSGMRESHSTVNKTESDYEIVQEIHLVNYVNVRTYQTSKKDLLELNSMEENILCNLMKMESTRNCCQVIKHANPRGRCIKKGFISSSPEFKAFVANMRRVPVK